MRFLVSEKSYESIVAGGLFTYSTGAREEWRVSQVDDGEEMYRIGRVDLRTDDWSALYHVISRENGELDRVVYRILPENNSQESKIIGNVVFDDGTATNLREVDGMRQEGEVTGSPFLLFPSITGLGWLLGANQSNVAVLDSNNQYGIKSIQPAVSKLEVPDLLTIGRHEIAATAHIIHFENQIRIVWLDQYGFPVRMCRPMPNDPPIIATESRYIRYN